MKYNMIHWEPVSNLDSSIDLKNKINKEYDTTEDTLHTNDRNIRALYPNESEQQIKNRILRNLRANPEYNR